MTRIKIRKNSVGNVYSKRDTKFSDSEGKKEDGVDAYFFRAGMLA